MESTSNYSVDTFPYGCPKCGKPQILIGDFSKESVEYLMCKCNQFIDSNGKSYSDWNPLASASVVWNGSPHIEYDSEYWISLRIDGFNDRRDLVAILADNGYEVKIESNDPSYVLVPTHRVMVKMKSADVKMKV